jgi:hypothetical protein
MVIFFVFFFSATYFYSSLCQSIIVSLSGDRGPVKSIHMLSLHIYESISQRIFEITNSIKMCSASHRIAVSSVLDSN